MTAYKEIDLSGLKTYSAADRVSKVTAQQEATPPKAGMTVRELLESFPDVLKAADLKAIARHVVRARKKNKPVIVMIGGHVIKTGCSPILADLASNGFITHMASNGSAAIHDTELARFGHTSEDVATQIEDGSFGMAEDTAAFVNAAAKKAAKTHKGFGEAMGEALIQENPPYLDRTLIARCFQLKIPYTLHVSIGSDIVHQHASADGAAIGDASLRDFRIFSASVSQLGSGGVILNIGSAVVMPEVFLKALAVSRNLGNNIKQFTTANFDMIQHYRPNVNIVTRPVSLGGNGYAITGHHEIMVPLLAAAIHEASIET